MASITTRREDLFPDGTVVYAYRANGRSGPQTGPPSGTPATSGTVASGAVTHTGLDVTVPYVLYASVGGQDRYLNVSTPEPPSDISLDDIDDGDVLGYDGETNRIKSLGTADTTTTSKRLNPCLPPYYASPAPGYDNGPAFRALLEDLRESGGVFVLPPGLYSVGEDGSSGYALAVPPRVTFEGSGGTFDESNTSVTIGKYSTIDLLDGEDCDLIVNDQTDAEERPGLVPPHYWARNKFEGINFSGNRGAQGADPSTALMRFTLAWGVDLVSCTFLNFAGNGAVFDDCNAVNFDRVTALTGNRAPVWVKDSADVQMMGCVFGGAYESSLILDNVFGCKFDGLFLNANVYNTQLNGAIASGVSPGVGETITVDATASMPLNQEFNVLIGAEQITVTRTSSTTLTVVARGAASTTPAAHADNARVQQLPPNGHAYGVYLTNGSSGNRVVGRADQNYHGGIWCPDGCKFNTFDVFTPQEGWNNATAQSAVVVGGQLNTFMGGIQAGDGVTSSVAVGVELTATARRNKILNDIDYTIPTSVSFADTDTRQLNWIGGLAASYQSRFPGDIVIGRVGPAFEGGIKGGFSNTLYNLQAGTWQSDAGWKSLLAAAASSMLAGAQDGDTVNRINVAADGKHTWGSGSATRDCTLYRSAAGQMDWQFTAVRTERAAGTDNVSLSFVTADSQPRFGRDANGTMTWGSGSAGRDTNLYRLGADALKTDDDFHVGSKFYVDNDQTPASAAAAGVKGQVAWDASYVYVCVATNTWKRAAIATW